MKTVVGQSDAILSLESAVALLEPPLAMEDAAEARDIVRAIATWLRSAHTFLV